MVSGPSRPAECAIRNEDGIIIAQAKNEGCNQHIHHVEFDMEQSAKSHNPYPTYGHWQKCNNCKFDATISEQQNKKYHSSREHQNEIEIFAYGIDQIER